MSDHLIENLRGMCQYGCRQKSRADYCTACEAAERLAADVPARIAALERQFHLSARDWEWKAAQNNNAAFTREHELAMARAVTWDLAARCVANLLDAQTSAQAARSDSVVAEGVTAGETALRCGGSGFVSTQFAVSLALLEAADRDVKPGTKIGEVTERIQARAREIYKNRPK